MVLIAHLADCHVGAWREPRMRSLGDEAFLKAVDAILDAGVDLVVLAGDLFNTALPGIDHIRHVFRQLGRLKDAGIPVYSVAGSHDYSPTGKTMLGVLEEAGLLIDVFQGEVKDGKLFLSFTTDPKTGVKLTGVLGRAGQLDSEIYSSLSLDHLESEPGTKVFLFHAAIRELLPKGLDIMEAHPLSFLPKGFSYYAGGHVHIRKELVVDGYGTLVYPGPVFPASFSELEDLSVGGLRIVEIGDSVSSRHVPLLTREVLSVDIDCSGLSSSAVEGSLRERLSVDVDGRIVLVRLRGELSSGSASDISFRSLFHDCESRGAYFCMKNSIALRSPQLIEAESITAPADEIERSVIEEHLGQIPLGVPAASERELFLSLLSVLGQPQGDGESKKDYEARTLADAQDVLERFSGSIIAQRRLSS